MRRATVRCDRCDERAGRYEIASITVRDAAPEPRAPRPERRPFRVCEPCRNALSRRKAGEAA